MRAGKKEGREAEKGIMTVYNYTTPYIFYQTPAVKMMILSSSPNVIETDRSSSFSPKPGIVSLSSQSKGVLHVLLASGMCKTYVVY